MPIPDDLVLYECTATPQHHLLFCCTIGGGRAAVYCPCGKPRAVVPFTPERVWKLCEEERKTQIDCLLTAATTVSVPENATPEFVEGMNYVMNILHSIYKG